MRKDISAKTPSLFAESDIISIDSGNIKMIEEGLKKERTASYRICLHKSADDLFHQMIIAHNKYSYYRPHKHLHKPEAYHMIKGVMGCMIFNDSGAITDQCILSEPDLNSINPFIYRIGENKWHCTLPLSDIVIFHESKPGPFLHNDDSIYPDWAPDGNDQHECNNYRNILNNNFNK